MTHKTLYYFTLVYLALLLIVASSTSSKNKNKHHIHREGEEGLYQKSLIDYKEVIKKETVRL
jgi:hypothetical protein